LAPPPPLSYLVNNRERSGSAARRHLSTPSLQSTSCPMPITSYSPSPPTAPSSILPSPTSSRPSDRPHTDDKDRVSNGSKFDGQTIPEQHEERVPSSDFLSPEPDNRGRTTGSSSRTLSSLNGPMTPATSHSQNVPQAVHQPQPVPANRPASTILRRDKSLPPIPGDSSVEFPNYPMPDTRPQTVFTYDVRTLPLNQDSVPQPQPGFRTPETRRQSFGGLSSRTTVSTLPSKSMMGRGQVNVPPFLAEESYTELGISPRLSFGQWPNGLQSQPSLSVPPSEIKPKKRKSRFGLSSLFGKKSTGHELEECLGYSTFRTSQSDNVPFDPMSLNGNGYSSPLSMHSGNVTRNSIMSKKNVDLVDQDREFIAYRYPSTDQTLDLQR